jgi:hypothetical protein
MNDTREDLVTKLTSHLGGRKLVWVGSRGHDAASFIDLPQFSESYGIIAPLRSVSLNVDFALENISGERADLDTYKIDDDRRPPARELRRRLLASLNEPAVVVAYRPFSLLSALCYPRSDFVKYLGMFHERQATFEHKPWVESELRKAEIPIIPWRYFANEDRAQLEEYVAAVGVAVLRTNRSDGGAGLHVIREPGDVAGHMPQVPEGFFAVAPFLEPNIPVNINACVFGDGQVSLHPPSLQVIGVEEFTGRRFGYCGNDFSAIKSLSKSQLAELETITVKAGRWLHSQGYRGAFGLDALIHDGEMLLAEINPRFQGSSLLSARIDKSLGRPDVYLCHLAAYFGRQAPQSMSLTELVNLQTDISQIVVHHTGTTPASLPHLSDDESMSIELAPAEGVSILPDGIVFRAVVHSSVTANGHRVRSSVIEAVKRKHALLVGDRSQSEARLSDRFYCMEEDSL